MILDVPWLARDDEGGSRRVGAEPRRDSAVSQRRGRPILIVDDDRSILETMSDLLEGEGYAIVTAADGSEALEVLAAAPVSFVLLDMRMPRMDGWAFARAARERGSKVPIIVMTAASDARRWAAEIGADAYIAKPFDVDTLLALVQRFADRSQDN